MSTAAQSAGKLPAGGYNLAKPQGKCCLTGKTIEPGEKFIAALREIPDGLERLDICLQAWPGFDRKDVLAWWQTVMPSSQQTKKKLFVDDQVLCELFEKLADASEPVKLNFRFVLGLILMRKRMLLYEGTKTQGNSEVWQVRFRGRQELLDLLNPRLDEQQIAQVSQQLGQIINEEL